MFNADMLLLAREVREMTQADAAEAAEVTQAMMSKIENRLVQPSPELIERLANTLGFPVEFFQQTERMQGFPHFHHRKRSKLGAKKLAKIHAIINIRRQHITKLLRSFDLPRNKPIPEIDLDERGLSPADVARMMREYWLIPRGPIESLTDLIEQAGGIVVTTNFDTALLDGISFRSPGLPPIFVMNKSVPGDRFRFSLAHELGHMIMHGIPDDDATMERSADEFAAAFLLPADEVRAYLTQPSLAKLGRAKMFWKSSIKSLLYRANQLNLITASQYRSLNILYNKAGYAQGEPFPVEVESPSLLSGIVSFHLIDLKYSVKELSDILCLREDEFRSVYLPFSRKLSLVFSRD